MTEEKKGRSKGCMIAAIIVGILVAIIVIGGVLLYIYRGDIADFGLNKITETIATEIKQDLPEGYTESDVDSIIEDFKQAVKDDRIDETEIQTLGYMFQSIFEDKKVDQDEAKKFLEEIKKAIED